MKTIIHDKIEEPLSFSKTVFYDRDKDEYHKLEVNLLDKIRDDKMEIATERLRQGKLLARIRYHVIEKNTGMYIIGLTIIFGIVSILINSNFEFLHLKEISLATFFSVVIFLIGSSDLESRKVNKILQKKYGGKIE